MPTVRLSNGIKFECSLDQTILDAAKKNKVAIEHSCNNGRCGACAAPLESGTIKLAKKVEFSDQARSEREILTCCCMPLSDIELGIEDLGDIGTLPILTMPCRISSLQLLSDDVIEVVLRMPPSSSFRFIAGQYIDLIYDGIRRSYSIGNVHENESELRLNVKKLDGGEMSDYLFHHARLNDLLRFEGPLGTFSFREDISENIVFLATGTGIAPVKAILSDLEHRKLAKNIFVIWGGRYLKDLYWDPKSSSLPLTYIPVLSREINWVGATGYVQDALLALNLDLDTTTVYACGSEVMIRDAFEVLVENGLPRNRFYSDAFVSSS